MIWLSDFDGDRRNNFTAIRILFAMVVFFGHSYAITFVADVTPIKGDPITPWIAHWTGSWIGAIAVNGFFAISGFLIAGSFARNGAIGCIVGRVLRIYPGLVVCTLLAVFVLGPAVTVLPIGEYLAHPKTHRYLWNATLVSKLPFLLPGVFEDHPIRDVNGSLWSLPPEVRCYAALIAAGALGMFRFRIVANAAILLALAAGFFFPDYIPLFGGKPHWLRAAMYFAIGMLAWTNRDLIPLHWIGALVAFALIIAARSTPATPYVFAAAFTYLVFFCAYRLPHLDADRFGDISYGLYIYAFPIQQMMFWPGQGGGVNFLLALPVVFGLACLSWFLVEKPALGWRHYIISRVMYRPEPVRFSK